MYEAKRGNRSVIFYPETAYWVSYCSVLYCIALYNVLIAKILSRYYYFLQVNVDVDVPLFLPIYAQRRQHDLRRLAVRDVRVALTYQPLVPAFSKTLLLTPDIGKGVISNAGANDF